MTQFINEKQGNNLVWHKTTFIYSLSLKHRVNVNVILRHQDEAAWSFDSHYSKTGFLFGNHKMCKCLFSSKISGHWVSVNSKGNKIKFNKTCDHRQTPRSVQWPRHSFYTSRGSHSWFSQSIDNFSHWHATFIFGMSSVFSLRQQSNNATSDM